MYRTSKNRQRLPVLICLALLPVLCGGCGEKKPQSEIISLEGKVEKIERTSDTTGKITVAFFSEKQKQEITGTAQVTKETEIMIDGAAATLKDLREGERVRRARERRRRGRPLVRARPRRTGGWTLLGGGHRPEPRWITNRHRLRRRLELRGGVRVPRTRSQSW